MILTLALWVEHPTERSPPSREARASSFLGPEYARPMDAATEERVGRLAALLRDATAALPDATARRRITKSGHGPSDPRLVEAELFADVDAAMEGLTPLLATHGLVVARVVALDPPAIERLAPHASPSPGIGIYIGTYWSFTVVEHITVSGESGARLLGFGTGAMVVVQLAPDGRSLERAF